MNDDYMYKADEEELNVSEDLAADDADAYYDPEEEGLSDFSFSDDEIPLAESSEEMEDAP